jgi:hypothetical protein
MKNWKENDKSTAICSFCKKLVEIVFKRRDLLYPTKNTIINNILVGVCNECDHVISIPQQSVEEINK